jgi:Lipid A 3-O-deacylase (PagL)
VIGGTRRRIARLAAGALLALACPPRPAEASDALDLPEKGRPEFSILAGYGHWIHVNPGRTREQLGMFQPQLGLRAGRRLEYLVEGHLAEYWGPRGFAAGLVPLGARYFFSGRGLDPYFQLGAGLCWTDLRVVEIDRRFNFILQGAAGLRRSLEPGRAWTVELRWLHYSNAGTVRPNYGLNALVLLGGWRLR